MLALLFVGLIASSHGAVAPNVPKDQAAFTEQEKLNLIQELEDEELAKAVEALITNLDADQLAKLETILSKDLDSEAELSMIQAELGEMGMDMEDINDLLDLASLMTKFLSKVPEVEQQLEDDEYTLEDHVKLYLLGLPNKLGPLGFLALHSVLQTDDDIVDVKIEGFQPDPAAAKEAATASVTPVGDIIARKRRESQHKAANPIPHNAYQVPKTYKAKSTQSADDQVNADIVAKLMERRRRSIN